MSPQQQSILEYVLGRAKEGKKTAACHLELKFSISSDDALQILEIAKPQEIAKQSTQVAQPVMQEIVPVAQLEPDHSIRPDFLATASKIIGWGGHVMYCAEGKKFGMPSTWQDMATRDLNQVMEWNKINPHYNCIAVGKPDGMVWFDDDDDFITQYETQYGKVAAPRVKSVSGGTHLGFKQTDLSRRVGNISKSDGNGGEAWSWRSINKYVIGFGSTAHPHNDENIPLAQYVLAEDCPAPEVPETFIQALLADRENEPITAHVTKATNSISDTPAWVRALEAKDGDFDAVLAGTPEISKGGRNTALIRVLGKLHQINWTDDNVHEAARRINEAKFQPTLSDSELKTTADSACRYPVVPTGPETVIIGGKTHEQIKAERIATPAIPVKELTTEKTLEAAQQKIAESNEKLIADLSPKQRELYDQLLISMPDITLDARREQAIQTSRLGTLDADEQSTPIIDDPSDHDSRFEMTGDTFNTKVYEDISKRFTVYPVPGDGDYISVLAKKLVAGTPISLAYVREPLKAIALHAIDGKLIHPAHRKLTLRGNYFSLGESEGGKTTGLEYALDQSEAIFKMTRTHRESLFRYKSEQTFIRSFTPEGTIKRDPHGAVKSGSPGHPSQFLHVKEGNLVAHSTDYFSAVFSMLTNLYDQTEAATESLTNGAFDAGAMKVSTVMCFTPVDFKAVFGGKGNIGGGCLNRWGLVNPPEDHSYDEKDWEPLSQEVIQEAVSPLVTAIFTLSQASPVVLAEEPGAARIRLEVKGMLKKAGKAGKRLLEYFMREQVAQAAVSTTGQLVMTEEQAKYAKRWVEAQLDCRITCWPSDANNQIEAMEHAIRTAVDRHFVSETKLKDVCNYYRESSGGWFVFNAARNNSLASGAIKLTGKTRKGTRAYCPGSCVVHPTFREDKEGKMRE